MRHHKKNARVQFWSAKAIAKRHRLRAESRLPESKPLPAPAKRSLSADLKPGEVAIVGWQYAPVIAPKWLTEGLARNADKAAKRARYERRFKRRALLNSEGL